MKISLVIPVYKNEASLPDLIKQLSSLKKNIPGEFHAVFVVDGSPDNSYIYLTKNLPNADFSAQVLLLSRNYGSFSAIRAGLESVDSDFYAVMAADLQEPTELIADFFKMLSEQSKDIVFGRREQRQDPMTSRIASDLFWYFYRKFVQADVPPGGVDLFGCTKYVRDHIISLKESNTTLVGLLLWVGFARGFVPYNRSKRPYGKSAWSFLKKFRYLLDSIFAFSDLPIRMLSFIGAIGLLISFVLFIIIFYNKIVGNIQIPGYAATVATILFFGALNSLGLGILGEYLWRTFENTKKRPAFIVSKSVKFLK